MMTIGWAERRADRRTIRSTRQRPGRRPSVEQVAQGSALRISLCVRKGVLTTALAAFEHTYKGCQKATSNGGHDGQQKTRVPQVLDPERGKVISPRSTRVPSSTIRVAKSTWQVTRQISLFSVFKCRKPLMIKLEPTCKALDLAGPLNNPFFTCIQPFWVIQVISEGQPSQ
jgi:hypothetical protein